MADLEKAQEQSRKEMEIMDELSDLRQRNARVEMSTTTDPDSILAALHAERVSKEEEERKRQEQEEDDALVAQYFSKIGAKPGVNGKAKANGDANGNGKGKEKVQEEGNGDASEGESSGEDTALPGLVIKRKPPPGAAGGKAGEPSVASLLAAKGKSLSDIPSISKPVAKGPASGSAGVSQAKRKREEMQKLLGIKKKVKA